MPPNQLRGNAIAAPTTRPGPSQHPAPTGRPAPERCVRLVHLTTVPETLLFLEGQAGFLREREFEVHAIASPGALLDEFGEREGVACRSVPMERRITPARDLVALARIWRVLRGIAPSIVDAHTPKAGLLGMLAARLARVPVRIYHLHGLRYLTARGPIRILLRTTERLAAALATEVVCVSRSVASVAVRDGVVAPAKITVLLGGSINGVDAQGRFRPPAGEEVRRSARVALGLPPEARVVGFVGRLVREKGIVELFEAWRALREEMADLRLVLVGPHEPHDPIPPAVTAALEADPRVVLAGRDWDTPRWYRALDVVALPSWREGFPVVPLEAAAMALPIVATRVPGCVDAVVDGVTGRLVPARDPGALAAALRVYLGDPALRAAHGAAARARVLAEFDRRRIWSALHAQYVRSLEAARGGARRGGRLAPFWW